jgi:hypothetical protein
MAIELTTASTAQLSGIRLYTQHVHILDIYPEAKFFFITAAGTYALPSLVNSADSGSILDFSHPDFTRCRQFTGFTSLNLTTIIGGANLVSLQDSGTTYSCYLRNMGFSAATLNAFFTALPATVRTATIDITNTTGAATCTTSIATAKGYSVITS